MTNTIVSCDPGAKGGIAWCHPNGKPAAESMPATERDIVDLFREISRGSFDRTPTCYIESVHSMPGQGVSSSFKFGRGFGFLLGVATTLGFRIELVTPQRWMKTLGIGSSKGLTKTQWKNKLKQEAQRKYPEMKVTLGTSDALLILEYGRGLK